MAKASESHEDYTREETVVGPSDKKFALTFAVIFLVIAAFGLWKGAVYGLPLAVAGATFLLLGFACPRVLAPLNKIWLQLGLLLYRIVNPIVMAILFFALFMPIGLFMRALGKQLLNPRFDRSATSYWVHREPPGPEPDSFKNQF